MLRQLIIDPHIKEGRMNIPLCFSFASMKIVKTSSAVSTASMNTPLTKLVPELNVVLTLKPVGNMTLTKKLEKMLPAS